MNTPAVPLRARAWALKARCYEAWHTDPTQAETAADELAALALTRGEDQLEIQALADWAQGIASLAKGQLAQALLRLEQAQAGFAALGDAQHAAETQVPQMVALAMMGRDDDAAERARHALQLFLQTGDERSAGKIELNLGTMLSRQDRHAEAETLFRQAAVRFARADDAEHSIVADIALANALTWQFRFDDALRVNARARMRARARGFAISAAHAEQAIGRIELHRGRWQAALQALVAACAQLAAAHAPPQRRIEAEAALADAYLAVNLLREAVQLYDQVIAQADQMAAPAEAAWAQVQRARALGLQGEHPRALAGLQQARARYVDLGHPTALAYADLCAARVALEAADGPAALASARRAVHGLATSGIRGWLLEARALEACALHAVGQADEASRVVAETLAAAPDLPTVRRLGLRLLGRIAEDAQHLAQARGHYEQVLAMVDDERQGLDDDDIRVALGGDAEFAHERLVQLAAARGEPAELLQAIEAGRARVLAASLPGDRAAPAPAAEHTQLHWLRARWQEAVVEGDDTRRQALEHSLLETRRRLALTGQAVAADPRHRRQGPQALHTAALQARLQPDTAVVLFHLAADQVHGVVVRRDGLWSVSTPVQGMDEQLRALRFQFDTWRFGASPSLQRHAAQLQHRVQTRLQALYHQIWAPLLPGLCDARHVVVVPHRGLHYLPFAALHDGQDWLLARHTLTLAPSAEVWLRLQGRPLPSAGPALVVGVGGPALPWVAAEVQAVAAALGPGTQVLAEGQATGAALRQAAPQARLLHLACHGRFRADSPAFSELQLADGPLTLMDLRRWQLDVSLVAMSACETGVSRVDPGGELLGLVRAGLQSGARNVLATLWPVQDEASAHLMSGFYQQLQAGVRPAVALQSAQLGLARQGAHPWLWAGVALHGRG